MFDKVLPVAYLKFKWQWLPRRRGLALIEVDILACPRCCGVLARSVIEVTGTLLALVTATVGKQDSSKKAGLATGSIECSDRA